MKKDLFIFLFISVLSSNVNAQTTKQTPVQWNVYKASDYSVSFPADWVTDTSKIMGIDLFIFSPMEANDKFRENVNILKSDLNGDKITLDSLVNVSVRQIETMANDFKLVKSARINDKGTSYHSLEFTATQGAFHLHFLQYYFLTENNVYSITLTTEASTYDRYKEIGERILRSFLISKY